MVSVIEEPQRSLAHLRNCNRWHYWPVQPVKKGPFGNSQKLGVVIEEYLEDGKSPPTRRACVYHILLGNIGHTDTVGEALKGVSYDEYGDLQALVDDGWLVD